MTKRYFIGAERFAVRRSWALLACALSVLSTGVSQQRPKQLLQTMVTA